MAHQTAQRRNLAAPHPRNSMEPTLLKYHTNPPTLSAAAAIEIVSNRFSDLSTDHVTRDSLNPSGFSRPSSGTQLLGKSMAVPSIADGSTASLTKSYSQRRPCTAGSGKGKEKTKNSREGRPIEGHEIKKAIVSTKRGEPRKSLPKAEETEELEEGKDVVKKPQASMSFGMNGGRRRSFCSSQAELSDFFSCNGAKVVSADMAPFMQIHAVDFARKTHDSLEKFTAKSLALSLKKEFDGVYGPAWHCIVGSSFGSFVTHSVGGFLYFSMGHRLYVLLFKTTVQRASCYGDIILPAQNRTIKK